MGAAVKPLRSSYPVGHLLNPQTRYVPSHATDVAETIRRAAKRIEREKYIDPLNDRRTKAENRT